MKAEKQVRNNFQIKFKTVEMTSRRSAWTNFYKFCIMFKWPNEEITLYISVLVNYFSPCKDLSRSTVVISHSLISDVYTHILWKFSRMVAWHGKGSRAPSLPHRRNIHRSTGTTVTIVDWLIMKASVLFVPTSATKTTVAPMPSTAASSVTVHHDGTYTVK